MIQMHPRKSQEPRNTSCARAIARGLPDGWTSGEHGEETVISCPQHGYATIHWDHRAFCLGLGFDVGRRSALYGGRQWRERLVAAAVDALRSIYRQQTFGPTNDASVQSEIRAAELEAWAVVDELDLPAAGALEHECDGWLMHCRGGDLLGPLAHTVRSAVDAGWLACEMSRHEERGERDAGAWTWDPTRPVAGQYAEWLLAQVTPHYPTGSPIDGAARFVCGDGVPDDLLDAQEHEKRRATDPDPRDDDDCSEDLHEG